MSAWGHYAKADAYLALGIGGRAEVLDDVGVPEALQDGALSVEVLHHLCCSRVQDLYRHQNPIPAPLVHLQMIDQSRAYITLIFTRLHISYDQSQDMGLCCQPACLP